MPKFASSIFIERLAGVNSVESETEYCKLRFIGRLLSVPNLPIIVKTLFRTRIESFSDEKISSIGVSSTIFEALCKPRGLLPYWEVRAAWTSHQVWRQNLRQGLAKFTK